MKFLEKSMLKWKINFEAVSILHTSVIVFILNPSFKISATLFFSLFFFFKRFENHFRLTRNKRTETCISRKYPWHVFQTRNLQLQCCKATRNDGREGKKPRQKMFRRAVQNVPENFPSFRPEQCQHFRFEKRSFVSHFIIRSLLFVDRLKISSYFVPLSSYF